MLGFKVSYKTEKLRIHQPPRSLTPFTVPSAESGADSLQTFHFQYDKSLPQKYLCPSCEQYLWDQQELNKNEKDRSDDRPMPPKSTTVTLPVPKPHPQRLLCQRRKHCCCAYRQGRRRCCLTSMNHAACKSRP